MPQIPVLNCCGCTACYNACEKMAITMTPSSEGFLYPKVNQTLCCECKKCEAVCPINNPPTLSEKFFGGFVAQSNSDEVLNQTTSGGFIDALYKYFTETVGGYAVGVSFDENFLPTHKIVKSYSDCIQFRNSKYAQSNLSDVFSKIKTLLLNDEKVLFVGTPCQVAGLKSFLNNDFENLITVDLVCRSVPSAKLWRSYLDWPEKGYNSKPIKVYCRKKTYGYHSGTLEILFENGKRYNGSNRVDYFMKAFHSDKCSRHSCYSCNFKTKHRCSDFTVFDSWQPEKVATQKICDNNKGFSNVVVHSAKGSQIITQIGGINLVNADVEKMFQFTGGMESNSVKKPADRNEFYNSIEKLGFEKGIKKHIKVTVKDRLIEKAKPIWYGVKK